LPLGFCADAILVYFPSFKPLSYSRRYLAWHTFQLVAAFSNNLQPKSDSENKKQCLDNRLEVVLYSNVIPHNSTLLLKKNKPTSIDIFCNNKFIGLKIPFSGW
jgi:hypothetical protein